MTTRPHADDAGAPARSPRCRSAHERYRSRLDALAGDGPVLDAIDHVCAGDALWPRERRWVRVYGRFFPDRPSYATLVYETVESPRLVRVVDVHERRPPEAPGRLQAPAGGLGWIEVRAFPGDPALPALPRLTARFPEAAVVRYRPGRRCCLRVEHRGEVCFVKVFADRSGERDHREGVELWNAARRGDIAVAVPRPDHWEPETASLWQREVPGRPITARTFESEGPGLASRMGTAAASIARSGLRPETIFDRREQQERGGRCARELRRRLPGLAPLLDELAALLDGLAASQQRYALRPVHGSLHVNQWLDGGGRLGLVDFEKFALSDRELDAGTFLAELDFEDPGRIDIDAVNEAFLDGYESVSGPLDPGLLAFYRAHKRLTKALKAAQALRPDGDARAERNLTRALAAAAETGR